MGDWDGKGKIICSKNFFREHFSMSPTFSKARRGASASHLKLHEGVSVAPRGKLTGDVVRGHIYTATGSSPDKQKKKASRQCWGWGAYPEFGRAKDVKCWPWA